MNKKCWYIFGFFSNLYESRNIIICLTLAKFINKITGRQAPCAYKFLVFCSNLRAQSVRPATSRSTWVRPSTSRSLLVYPVRVRLGPSEYFWVLLGTFGNFWALLGTSGSALFFKFWGNTEYGYKMWLYTSLYFLILPRNLRRWNSKFKTLGLTWICSRKKEPILIHSIHSKARSFMLRYLLDIL